MQNQLTASITFYFKGEKFVFSSVIAIDHWLDKQQGEIEALYDIIAIENGLDRYRHEYDVMVMEPIQFSHATGLAVQYIHDGIFDKAAYQTNKQQRLILSIVENIAKIHFNITSLEQHPKLKAALLQAYYARKNRA